MNIPCVSESRDPLALKRGGIGHSNVIWRPLVQFAMGAEYLWWKSRATNDALGTNRRIQWMARFDF